MSVLQGISSPDCKIAFPMWPPAPATIRSLTCSSPRPPVAGDPARPVAQSLDAFLFIPVMPLVVSVHGRGGVLRFSPQCGYAVELRWPSGQSAKVELQDFDLKRERTR